MNANRSVKKFENYDEANKHKAFALVKKRDDILRGLYKVKIKRRPNGHFEVVGYDTRKKMTSGEPSDV